MRSPHSPRCDGHIMGAYMRTRSAIYYACRKCGAVDIKDVPEVLPATDSHIDDGAIE